MEESAEAKRQIDAAAGAVVMVAVVAGKAVSACSFPSWEIDMFDVLWKWRQQKKNLRAGPNLCVRAVLDAMMSQKHCRLEQTTTQI